MKLITIIMKYNNIINSFKRMNISIARNHHMARSISMMMTPSTRSSLNTSSIVMNEYMYKLNNKSNNLYINRNMRMFSSYPPHKVVNMPSLSPVSIILIYK